MWNQPTEKQLNKIPRFYSSEQTPLREKKIYMHFFLFSADWYIAEYDPDDRIFFGFACLGDPQNAEWGYVSFDELIQLRTKDGFQVDRDLHWKPKMAWEITCNCGHKISV